MRKPRPSDCYDDTTDSIDWECYNEASDRYADEKRDEELERQWEARDNKDEKDENDKQ